MKGVTLLLPIAYDWDIALAAIDTAYDYVDEIILGLDIHCISWAHKRFQVHQYIKEVLQQHDPCHKMKLVEANFHRFEVPALNEVHERNYLSLAADPGNWLLSLDSDEELLNPEETREFLLGPGQKTEADFLAWAAWSETVYKVFEDEGRMLLVSPAERPNIATRLRDSFTFSRDLHGERHGTHTNYPMSPARIRHWAYGRSPEAIRQKLTNWGHADDMAGKVDEFMRRWVACTLENYTTYQNFHPIVPESWGCLVEVPYV